ncbi:peptide YY [Bifidobacterium pseudolongum subsp. globosum]|uniref:Peptide YY n=2 Tax=Bifidobacterium pseudolongum TaxID=1694 RepID=A0A2N3QQA6_9BIFI|nr:peptide YY [Bifidobacterium pseudolongum subsp. globosum]PKV01956.1 peptide YY [Bifidobacterium pseudolongum subsp. globosum]
MRSCGTSGITTRFQELFRCMGQVGHALLTRSPLSPRQQAARDPVRLACVKHAASVHPEPESNPPQKTFMESQQTALKKKKDGPSNKEGRSHKNPDTHQTPSGTTRAGIGLAIKNHKPHPHGCDPWQVVQYTLLSSQTTKHSRRTPGANPSRSPTGSKMNNLHEPQPKRKPTPTTHPQNPTTTMLPPACRTHATPTSYSTTHSPQPH